MEYFVVYKVEKSVNIFETKNAIIFHSGDIRKEEDILEMECYIADEYEGCSNKDITLVSFKPLVIDETAIYLTFEEYELLTSMLHDKLTNLQSLVKNKFVTAELNSLFSDQRMLNRLVDEIKTTNNILEKVQGTRI